MCKKDITISSLENEIFELEGIRQYALDQIVGRDVKYADLEYRFQCSILLIEESLNFIGINSNTTLDMYISDLGLAGLAKKSLNEVKDSYKNRASAFIAVNKQPVKETITTTVSKKLEEMYKDINKKDPL